MYIYARSKFWLGIYFSSNIGAIVASHVPCEDIARTFGLCKQSAGFLNSFEYVNQDTASSLSLQIHSVNKGGTQFECSTKSVNG